MEIKRDWHADFNYFSIWRKNYEDIHIWKNASNMRECMKCTFYGSLKTMEVFNSFCMLYT